VNAVISSTAPSEASSQSSDARSKTPIVFQAMSESTLASSSPAPNQRARSPRILTT
jgi:hypothetical protein